MADLLNPDALHHELHRLDGWDGTTEGLHRTYAFTDFAESMQFVNHVAELAEQANHHPDIDIRYNQVRLSLFSHSAGGVTQSDIELARRIDGGAEQA